jgi:hypothetical protein
MEMLPSLGVVAVVALALVHVFAGKIPFAGAGEPRSAWLSAAAGTSVAYVFVHLLPELGVRQESYGSVTLVNEEEIYVAALSGLIFFYALESANRKSRREGDGEKTSILVFWISTIAFALFNALLGYALGRQGEVSITELILFTVVIGIHFVVNDAASRRHHKEDYDRIGRWVLAAAIVLGWSVSRNLALSDLGVNLMFGFLAGGIVLNVLKEELPEEQGSAFWAFLVGAAGYTLFLMLL